MFRYLAPAAIFATALIGSWFIENTFPNGDSRNMGGACCMVIMAPAALVYIYPALKEILLPNGGRVFIKVALCWMLVPVLSWLFLEIIVAFGLFKHGW